MNLAAAEAGAASPILKDGKVLDVAIGIGVIALVVVLLPIGLGIIHNRGAEGTQPAAGRRMNFFEIPYITWFVVHYGIATLAILAVVLLGVDNVIDKGTVSALLGSLFGYVLGNVSRSGGPGGGGSAPPPKPLTDPKASGKPSLSPSTPAPVEQRPDPEGPERRPVAPEQAPPDRPATGPA
jgi:hypothetical protein